MTGCRIAVIFFRDTHRRLSEDIANTDEGILENGCIPSEPFTFADPPIYMATNSDTQMATVVHTLRDTEPLPTLFIFFNHYSELRPGGAHVPFKDPLIQQRPANWGLWSGEPWPQWNYSSQVNAMFRTSIAKLPVRYAALQWRMELVDPVTLMRCSDQFAEAVISGMRIMGLDTIYVASDMPIDGGKDSKSASFNPPEVARAKESIDHLTYRLNEASFFVKTWQDIKPSDGDKVRHFSHRSRRVRSRRRVTSLVLMALCVPERDCGTCGWRIGHLRQARAGNRGTSLGCKSVLWQVYLFARARTDGASLLNPFRPLIGFKSSFLVSPTSK